MAWPLASHFSAMLQNPKFAFRDPALQACHIEKDGMNQPRPWAGAFAVVYKGTSLETGRSFAVRVFTTESPERRERYDLISDYLKGRKLASLVEFEYRDRAIRSASDGKFYPMIWMDWVQGETLYNWARDKCQARDAVALAGAAHRWVAMIKELAENGIAHGDLQHANVMLTDAGDVKLVDYDGMCVPALLGRRNLEVGVEPYQHPDRGETTLLSLDLDHYSSLVIYTALRALAAQTDLWERYVDQPGNDKLLFRKEDLRSPDGSALISEVRRSPDPEVRDLIDRLLELTQTPIDRVPPLTQVVNTYGQIEDLLRRQEWAEAVQLLNRRGQFRDAPAELRPLIKQAYEIVCRDEAWEKFAARAAESAVPSEQGDRLLTRAWNESLFSDFQPAEAERPRVEAARYRLKVLERVAHVLQQSMGRIELETERVIASLATHFPPHYEHSLEQRVAEAQRRAATVEWFEQTATEPCNDTDIMIAWRILVELKAESLVTRPDVLSRIDAARRRAPVLERLNAIPGDLSIEQYDRQLLSAWQEDVLAGCAEADPWRPLVDEARRRTKLAVRLADAANRRDLAASASCLADACLADYPFPPQLTAWIRTVYDSVSHRNELLQAVASGDSVRFAQVFDARLIRAFADAFAPHRESIAAWTRSILSSAGGIGLRPAVGRASLAAVEEPKGAYRARWTWPQPRFCDECVLAACSAEPAPDEDPETVPAAMRITLDRSAWEKSGGSWLILPERNWGKCVLAVWAKVDLGFCRFFSSPLVLGTLESARSWFGWLPFGGSRPTSPSNEPSSEPVNPETDDHA